LPELVFWSKGIEETASNMTSSKPTSPHYVPALTGIGLALDNLANHTGAIEYYNKVLAIDPLYVPALGNKGLALLMNKPGKTVTAPIKKMAELYRQNPVKYARYEYISDNEDYLCGVEDDNGNEVQPAKRIEIDSVLKKVGGRAFARWIISELEERFPNRDYNRAIKDDGLYLREV
jgi:tetratricopeptide (TPR) repeat protein